MLRDVEQEDVEALIKYMYCGEITYNEQNFSRLNRTANVYKIRGFELSPSVAEYQSVSSYQNVRESSPINKDLLIKITSVNSFAEKVNTNNEANWSNPTKSPSRDISNIALKKEYNAPFDLDTIGGDSSFDAYLSDEAEASERNADERPNTMDTNESFRYMVSHCKNTMIHSG